MKMILEAASEEAYFTFVESASTMLHMAKLDEILIIHPNKINWTKVFYGYQ